MLYIYVVQYLYFQGQRSWCLINILNKHSTFVFLGSIVSKVTAVCFSAALKWLNKNISLLLVLFRCFKILNWLTLPHQGEPECNKDVGSYRSETCERLSPLPISSHSTCILQERWNCTPSLFTTSTSTEMSVLLIIRCCALKVKCQSWASIEPLEVGIIYLHLHELQKSTQKWRPFIEEMVTLWEVKCLWFVNAPKWIWTYAAVMIQRVVFTVIDGMV